MPSKVTDRWGGASIDTAGPVVTNSKLPAPSVVFPTPSTSLSTVRTSPAGGRGVWVVQGHACQKQGLCRPCSRSDLLLSMLLSPSPPTRHAPECPGNTLRSGGSAATWGGASGSGCRSAPSTCSPDSPMKWLSPQQSSSTSMSSRQRSRAAPGAAGAPHRPAPGGAAGPRAEVNGRPPAGCRGCSTGCARADMGAALPDVTRSSCAAAAAPPQLPPPPSAPGGDSWRGAYR